MRIALFTETFLPQINGVVRTLEKVVRHLEDNGHEVLLLTIGEGDRIFSKTEVIRVEGIPFSLYKELNLVKPEDKWFSKLIENEITQIPISILQSLIPCKHSVVEAALDEFKPDLLHLATPVSLGAIGFYYKDKLKLPCLATFHTDLAAYAPMYQIPYIEEIINAATKTTYARAHRILAPSPSSKNQLEKIGLKNVGVFGRGVDQSKFNPNRADRAVLSEYGLDPEKTTLLYVGRLAEEKSIPEIIDAFNDLSQKYDIQLLLVGDGPIRTKLEEELENADGGFAFAGIKKGDELACLYASSDIFVFPSRTETFGQVVLEAMASALPVVGYDSPGVCDLVLDNQNGYLVTDFQNFKFAIEDLIKHKEKRKIFGQKSFELAQARSWTTILNNLLDEYQSLIDSKELSFD
jgi:glycosyltransferase involved in cell wall biosynthesis